MSSQTKEKYKNTVDISLYLEEWSRCLRSGNQRDNLYRFGKFDSCTVQWDDLMIVFRAKATRDQREIEQMMANTHYVKHLGSDPKASPTAGVIWELKEKPGWD